METTPNFDPDLPERHVLEQAVGTFIAAMRFVGRHLASADLSPHEGRLRASAVPAKYMDIPDFPPLHDDTLG